MKKNNDDGDDEEEKKSAAVEEIYTKRPSPGTNESEGSSNSNYFMNHGTNYTTVQADIEQANTTTHIEAALLIGIGTASKNKYSPTSIGTAVGIMMVAEHKASDENKLFTEEEKNDYNYDNKKK